MKQLEFKRVVQINYLSSRALVNGNLITECEKVTAKKGIAGRLLTHSQ